MLEDSKHETYLVKAINWEESEDHKGSKYYYDTQFR
jgi:hypothetical protein